VILHRHPLRARRISCGRLVTLWGERRNRSQPTLESDL